MVSVEDMYNNYLEVTNLKGKIGTVQDQELRKAFYGAVGSFLAVITNMGNDSEEAIHNQLDAFDKQVIEFFQNEVNKEQN